MSGLFGTFNIAKRGMQAQQTALQITSHNVANANTEGYSVQRANLKTTQPFGMASLTSAAEPGQLGTGVEVSSITRARDAFLDYQIRKEKSTLGKYNSREEFLSEIETIYMEPSDTGLSSSMTKFWDAWQQLATTPESSTTRTMVVQNAEALVDAIQHNYKQLENLQVNSGDVIKDQIFDVNNNLKQIADLNEQIKAVVISGKTPNDLMDRRDLLLDQLSERFGIEVTETDFSGIKLDAKLSDGSTRPLVTSGTLNTSVSFLNKVYYDNDTSTWKADIYQGGRINDVKTVTIPDSEINKYVETDGTTVKAMKVHTIFYDGTSDTLDGTANLPAQFESGSLQGYESINTDIEEYKKQLNNTARALAVSVNAIHSAEKNAKTGEYINFFDFNESDPEPAKNLKINSQIVNDVSLINAGRNYTDNGLEYENAGNGEMALLIGQLRNTRMDIQDISTIADFRTKYLNQTTATTGTRTETKYSLVSSKTGTTVDSYFKDSVANLGVSAQEAKKMVTNQEALLNQLDTRRESVSGVSLDEEMTNMLQFQKSYEANAKMISVIDQLLDVVVNGLIKR